MSQFWAICWTLLALAGVCQLQETCDDPATNQLPECAKKYGPEKKYLTLDAGEPLDSAEASLTCGKHGPMPLQDYVFMDTMSRFNSERIPERVVHARGTGAFGYFEVTHDITKYTKAEVFKKIGKKTNIVVRFSLVAVEPGGSEVVRNPRGMAVKFYTEHGIWDLVTLSTPVFSVRDPMLFPAFDRSQRRNPQTNLRDANMAFDLITLTPESVHQVIMLFSDLGIPDGYRHMDSYGINTFKMVNKENIPFYVKFILESDQGAKSILPERATNLSGTNPDYFTRDLFNAIYRKEYPSWTMNIQVMTFEQAEKLCYNPFDATKIWPEEDFPHIPVGKIVLNRNPTNYFAEVEQLALDPSNLVPGIEPGPDRVLQGRLFSYKDAQRYRLGANHHELPINLPFAGKKITNIDRDGSQAIYNQDGAPNYYPNSFAKYTTVPCAAISEFYVTGDVKRYDTGDEDNFSQAAMFWNKLTEEEKIRLVENIVSGVQAANNIIQMKTVKLFHQVNKNMGKMLSEKLGFKPTQLD